MTTYPALDLLEAQKQAVLENFWHPPSITQNSPLLAKFAPNFVAQNSPAALASALAAHKAKLRAAAVPVAGHRLQLANTAQG